MRIIGFDPGTWRAGIGVVDFDGKKIKAVHFETLNLQPASAYSGKGGLPLKARLKKLYDNLQEIFKVYQAETLALEDIFFHHSFSSAVRIGEARAVAMLAASQFDMEIFEYKPTEVKKAISGNGRASKVQVQFMVRHLLQLRENPQSDAADALAVAICHCQARNGHVLLSAR